MFINNYYYYYKKAFSPEFCDYVMNKGTSLVNQPATIGGGGKGGRKDLKMRSSNVAWISDPSILDPVKKIMQETNKRAGWNFHLGLNVDHSAYKGEEFEFDYRDVGKGKRTEVVTQAQDKGSCLMFPSFMWHRVRPVKKGVRYSLVVWLTGENFR